MTRGLHRYWKGPAGHDGSVWLLGGSVGPVRLLNHVIVHLGRKME